ncbi:unnamed protein product [Fraxinus pennsylvanica]|uniref:Integrase catalytic domain-containing protein n=1 Tax=Fraxinus pennsylvanica TaxID=56036 RepID=A0AAD2E4Q7_9LAMI|nr:unnamed protein product [Fraxinus pennsylvanica]
MCFSTKSSSESRLIDNGCTNHMTYDRTLFTDLKPAEIAKVRIGNGDYISAKGKGTIAITTNSEVAGVFWKFKKIVENKSCCKIQVLRSDNGKEYTSAKFNLFCEEAGIEHQLTAPYTLEQNGVKRDKLDKKAIPVRGTRLLSDIYQRCNVAIYKPAGHEEALKDSKWKKAMEEEMLTTQKNKTWELVERPEDRKVIGVKWVYRTKLNADYSINKYKARLIVKGYAQIFGVDYSDFCSRC